jgi:hypothetical protein
MTAKEFNKYVRDKKLYEKSKSLAAFDDGSIFINADLDELEKEAKKSSLKMFVEKDNRKNKKDTNKDGTTFDNV